MAACFQHGQSSSPMNGSHRPSAASPLRPQTTVDRCPACVIPLCHTTNGRPSCVVHCDPAPAVLLLPAPTGALCTATPLCPLSRSRPPPLSRGHVAMPLAATADSHPSRTVHDCLDLPRGPADCPPQSCSRPPP